MAQWDGEAGDDRDVLWRIVALLLALAGLADLAAGLSGNRRRNLLAVLSWGEARACGLVVGMAAGASDPANEPEVEDDSPFRSAGLPCGGLSGRAGDGFRRADDAAVLAARLRMLALMLCYALANTAPFTLHRLACPEDGRCSSVEASGPRRDAASPAFDTS